MTIMRFLITILLSLSSAGYSYAKLPPLKWVKSVTATTISPKNIIDVSESQFLCTDTKKIVVVNAGDGTLDTTISGFSNLTSIAKTFNNNFVIADGNKITVLSEALVTVWSKPILSSLTLAAVIQTNDSGFAAIGKVADSTRIIKTDKNGDTLWTRTITNSCTIMNGIKIIEVDGGIIACGTCCTETCIWMNGWISKYTSAGSEVWTKVIVGFTIYDMIPVSNGAVLTGSMDLATDTSQSPPQIAGLAKKLRFPTTDIPFIHIGADGIFLVTTSFGGIDKNWGNTIRKFTDTFVMACYMFSYVNPSLNWVQIIASDSAGVKKWSQQYNLTPQSSYTRPVAQPLPSGDLVVFASDSLYYYSDPTEENGYTSRNESSSVSGFTFKVSQSSLCFTLKKKTQIQITLHTINGKMVQSFGKMLLPAGLHRYRLSGTTPGAYVLRIKYDAHYFVQKAVFYR